MSVLPCSRIESACGNSPSVVSTTLSGEVLPLALSSAPPVAAEFSQPWPDAPLFAHGQGASDPSPAQIES